MKKKTGYLAGAVAVVLVIAVVILVMHGRSAGDFPQTMYVAENICKIRAGAGQEYEVVGLLAKGESVVAWEMKEAKDGQTWYKLDTASLAEELDLAGKECYIRSDLLVLN